MLPGTRYASMALRTGFVLALLLGIGFWTSFIPTGGLVLLHMFIGLAVVASLWYLGLAQAQRAGGSLGLTLGTFVLGLVLAIVGLLQLSFLNLPIQITHVALAVLAVGLGEMCYVRIRRAAAVGGAR
jgi:hypothetical protein